MVAGGSFRVCVWLSLWSQYKPASKLYDTLQRTRNIIEQCLHLRIKRPVCMRSVHAIPEATEHATISELASFSL